MKSISSGNPLLFLLFLCLAACGLVSAAPLSDYEYWGRSDPYAEAYHKAREWAEHPTFAARASRPAQPAQRPNLSIWWSRNARNDLTSQTSAEWGGHQPQAYQEALVRQYWARTPAVAHATGAKIIRAAHKGGTNPREPDHITVGFKDANGDEINDHAYHVYTGRQ
ncbi:hypothetical protein POSPLADRAFT_1037540 [Postia placenta MAD-698-R-SB12]|uniref:SCP domain-containing protein n=1 Tax=Postia placenta MAD-698-R-SB12 TaxID=670580 RepID=A0A1X6MIP4_9APHY|nr:hypothetical protein POSPLADRAFT_1037540 [Postia placenta MAD-698-R-SB12]OSX56240.1 hypothetical protein POSPLADRAFT_1037540 [Postia placenta MAD-698-R-SB12]